MTIDIDAFTKLNWRQGAVLSDASSIKIATELALTFEVGAGDLIVVISHDCDVNARSFTDEPNVELIIARKATKDGNKKMGKSSRFLQLELDGDAGWYEMKAFERFTIPRHLLEGHSPSAYLSNDNSEFLSEWLARRYARSAFPNSFDTRLEPIKDKIKKCLKSVSEDVFGIYFKLHQDEITEDQIYKAIGFAVMLDADYQDTTKADRVVKALTKLQGLLDQVKIEFDEDIGVVSDKEFSLEDVRLTKRWDWDVLSYDDGQSAYVKV